MAAFGDQPRAGDQRSPCHPSPVRSLALHMRPPIKRPAITALPAAAHGRGQPGTARSEQWCGSGVTLPEESHGMACRAVLVDARSERRALMRRVVDAALGSGTVVAEADGARDAS